jgi:asparagine synthase (glutamine-hydrolysing)
MCGIAGCYFKEGATRDELHKMARAMAHRGPDAEGVYVNGSFGLAHRRLSILDLSSTAHQPMVSSCGRYHIAYNGEVYNFKSIKAELGIETKTSSDTEVILEAFAQIGPRMVEKLNGMFAIAILDIITNKLFFFRDRMGIKPLYVYQKNNDLVFGSELKAITALGSTLSLSVNKEAISYFLHLGYIPEPHSIYNEIQKFPSGNWGMFDGTTFTTSCYWSPEEKISKDVWTDEFSAKIHLDQLLTDAVERRLISDVPFGTFLSGGVDSSLVTALAQKVSSSPVKTFSIGVDNAKYNEARFANQVAQHLGTEHHSFTVTEKDALELITEIIPQFDEPFSDSSAIPTMLVSKMARQSVTMTLSGDGGDELFMGYGAYVWANRLSHPIVKALRTPTSLLLSHGNDRQKRVSKLLSVNKRGSLSSHIFSQEQNMFSVDELSILLHTDHSKFELLEFNSRTSETLNRKLSSAEQQALFDIRFYLKDDLLVKVDRATMRYGLETRVPLLDHTVVEFALNLAPELKMNNGISKYLLKEVLYQYVPKNIFNRPKWGFSIPLVDWLNGDLSFLIEEYLNEKRVISLGLVNWPVVKNLIHSFRNGQHHLYNRLWLLILLHQWFALRESSSS